VPMGIVEALDDEAKGPFMNYRCDLAAGV
jgi:hypothetical protein